MAQPYEVQGARTAKVVAQFSSRQAAYDDADRRDTAFGAVRYRVVRNYDVMSDDEFAAMMADKFAVRVAA